MMETGKEGIEGPSPGGGACSGSKLEGMCQ